MAHGLAITGSRTAKVNLIVDTDCGFDDLFAISLLCASPKVEIDYISTVGGMNTAIAGYGYLTALFGSTQAVFTASSHTPSVFCGSDLNNLPDLPPWLVDYRLNFDSFISSLGLAGTYNSHSSHDVSNLDELLGRLPDIKTQTAQEETVLLCLGPLTNIASILKDKPLALSRCLSKLVIMGGAYQVPGNAPNGAEFNFYVDPVSAHEVVHTCGIPVEMIGLDVANKSICNDKFVESLVKSWSSSCSASSGYTSTNGINLTQFLRQLLAVWPESVAYDSIASYYFVNPDAFQLQEVEVHVDPSTGVVHPVSGRGTRTDRSKIARIKIAVGFAIESYRAYLRNIL